MTIIIFYDVGDTSGSQDIQSENAESCFVNSTPIAGSETSEGIYFSFH